MAENTVDETDQASTTETETATVPVTETDHNALMQGWIVGKRLAAQRGKA
jgi:hypothetical protein